jgi:hypothetical protein
MVYYQEELAGRGYVYVYNLYYAHYLRAWRDYFVVLTTASHCELSLVGALKMLLSKESSVQKS